MTRSVLIAALPQAMSNPTPTTETLFLYAATPPIGITYPMCPSAISATRSALVATSRSWARVFSSWVPKIASVIRPSPGNRFHSRPGEIIGNKRAGTERTRLACARHFLGCDSVIAQLSIKNAFSDIQYLRCLPSITARLSQRCLDRGALDLRHRHPGRELQCRRRRGLFRRLDPPDHCAG